MSFVAEQNRYRPEIDGLRALAVTVVVLFHAEVPGFSGGFVGVDVFFVISGFLITGILARSFASGTFSPLEFFERRARRILPAFFVMVVGVVLVAPFIISPWDIPALGRSVKYVALSVGNIDFYRTLGEYSGDDASLAPLLHTWSLGVEEQFYIAAPFFWLALCKFTRKPSHWLNFLAGMTLASFLLTAWTISRDQPACFFLLPYRAWELAAGGLLALAPMPTIKPTISRVFGTAGLGMILAATFCFNESTTFPGPWALLPCVGAALVIAASLGTNITFPSTLLRTRPLVFTGLISYSVYLLHWPALVFVNYCERYSGTDALWWQTGALICLTYVAGWISWRFVENPLRKPGKWSRGTIYVLASIGIAILFGLGYFIQKTTLFLERLPEEARLIAEARYSNNPMFSDERSPATLQNPHRYGSPEGVPETVLWGDSHAREIAYPLHELALVKSRSFHFYGRSGTPPVRGIVCGPGNSRRENAEYTDEVYEALVRDKSVKNVILSARWSLYTEGYTGAYGPAEKSKKLRNLIVRAPGNPPAGSAEVRTVFAKALEETVLGLVNSGKRVYLVYPVPELAYTLPQVLAIEVMEGRDPAKFTISAEKVYYERTAPIIAMMEAISQREEIVRIRPEELLIENGNILLLHQGKLLYSDDDHLSIEGGRFIMPLFKNLF